MRAILLLILLPLALALDASCVLGHMDNTSIAVPFDKVLANPSAFNNKLIRITGLATTGTVSNSGHMMLLTGATGVMYVSAKDEYFTFPTTNHAGVQCIIDGYVSLNWFGNHSRLEPIGIVEVQAVGVSFFSNEDVCVGSPDPILVGDLAQHSLHGIGMGSGYVCLAPGGEMPVHSTEDSSEIVTCLTGTITLTVYTGPHVQRFVANPLQAIFLPRGTVHGVQNMTPNNACYIYTHADVRNQY